MAAKDFIVAIELGSSKMTGIAGQKNLDGSINVLAMVHEDSSSFIHKGVVYNIDKTAQCINLLVTKLAHILQTQITQVYVGVGGQSIRSIRNVITKDLPVETKVSQEMVIELMDANRNMTYPALLRRPGTGKNTAPISVCSFRNSAGQNSPGAVFLSKVYTGLRSGTARSRAKHIESSKNASQRLYFLL